MTAGLVEAVTSVVPPDAAPVEVLGEGAAAAQLREALGRPGDGRPAVVVDTTGDPARIADALERLDDLGTLVLAGPTPSGPVPLDLYSDLHVRGLTVVGVPPGT